MLYLPGSMLSFAGLCLVQMKDEQLRLEEDEATMKKRLKETREDHKKWEETREGRVCLSHMQARASGQMLIHSSAAWLLHWYQTLIWDTLRIAACGSTHMLHSIFPSTA